MKIKEMNQILRDKSKQDLTCNFKLTGGRSKFDIIIDRLDKIDRRIDNLIKTNNLKE